MTGWDACTMEPNAILRWIECHPGVAGYVQAVGTLLAVGVALLAPAIAAWISAFQRRAELRARTRNLIKMLATPVIDVGVNAAHIKTILDRHRATPPNTHAWANWFDNLFLKLPTQIEFLQQHAGIDDEAFTPHRELQSATFSYNSIRHQILMNGHAAATTDWANVWRILNEALVRVQDAVTLAA